MFDLTGRTALVTGASGGLGGAIARALHATGGRRRAIGHTPRRAGGLAADLGERAYVLPCDLADSGAVEALVPAAEAAMGSLDILVNNAGVTRDNLFMRMKDAEWETVLAVNLTAAFRLARASLKGMMKRRHGRIVGITSIVGVTGNPGQGNYAAAKAGMIGMSKALAQEVASRGITVNCVAPGFIASPMTEALNEKQREAILANVPTGKLGAGRRYRRRGRLSRQRRSGLRYRTNPARKWRNGYDLTAARQVVGLSPCRYLCANEPLDRIRRPKARGARLMLEREQGERIRRRDCQGTTRPRHRPHWGRTHERCRGTGEKNRRRASRRRR